MAKVAKMIIDIGADLSDFEKKMGQLQSSMQKIGKGFKDVGKKLTTSVSAPIAGLGAAIVVTGANFESSMNKVAAISGATGKDLQDMTDLAKKLGATTKFSASEAADGMSYLAMAGFEVKDILAAMPGMLDLAAASGMDLASTADIASNIMSGFSIEASNATKVADVLAKASSSANTDVHQLGEAMKYAAPVANSLGLSMEETAAAIGFMSDAGIQGSLAGTALRGGLSRLASNTSAQKAMKELGINVFDAEGNMKSLDKVVGEVNKATKNMTKEQRAQALAMLFGQEAASGWIALLDRGEDELASFTGALQTSDGTAKGMAETMNSGMLGAFTQIKSALEGLAIEFSEILAPAIMKVAEVIQKVIAWFSNLDTKTKTIIVVVAGLAAAIGPVLLVIGTLIMLFSTLISPVTLIVAGILALIAALVVAYTQSETFREIVNQVFTFLQEIVTTVIEIVTEIFTAFWEFLLELWETHGESLVETVTTFFTAIWEFIEMILDVIKGVIEVVLNFIKDIWDKHGETIMELVGNAFTTINDIVTRIVNGVHDLIKKVTDKIKEIWEKHGDSIMKIIEVAMEVIQKIIDVGMKAIQIVMEVVWPLIQGVIEVVWNTIEGIVETAVGVVTGIIDTLISLLEGDFKGAWEGMKEIVNNVWDGIKQIITGGVNFIIDAINAFIKGMNKVSFDIPDWVPGLGGKNFGINIPLIPRLAKGGIAGGATLAEIGEGAHPEMVAPLNNATMKPFAALIATHMPSREDKEVVVKVDPIGDRPIYLVTADGEVLAEYVADNVRDINDRDQDIDDRFK